MNYRRKSIVTLSVTTCILALVGGSVGLVLVTRYSDLNGTNMAVPNGAISNAPILPEPEAKEIASIDEIPKYKDADLLKTHCDDQLPDSCWYWFSTPDKLDKPLTFFRDFFSQNNWELTRETDSGQVLLPNIDHALWFVWQNKENEIPTRRFAKIELGQNSTDKVTYITIRFGRWPDATKVPIYVDGKALMISWSDKTYKTRITNYLSSASIQEISDFYDTTMIQQGWLPHKVQSGKSLSDEGLEQVGLIYTYNRSDAIDLEIGSIIEISLKARADEQTDVTISTYGPDITRLWEAEHK